MFFTKTLTYIDTSILSLKYFCFKKEDICRNDLIHLPFTFHIFINVTGKYQGNAIDMYTENDKFITTYDQKINL